MLYACLRWSASARAHVHTRLPHLANGWADCVRTWCAASDPLDERLTQVRCGVHLHVRTCTPLSHDGASSPARPSPIKASYWSLCIYLYGIIDQPKFRWILPKLDTMSNFIKSLPTLNNGLRMRWQSYGDWIMNISATNILIPTIESKVWFSGLSMWHVVEISPANFTEMN